MNRCDGGGGGAGDENVRVKRGRCALTASPLSIKIRRRRRSVVVRRRRRHGRRRLRRGTSKEGGGENGGSGCGTSLRHRCRRPIDELRAAHTHVRSDRHSAALTLYNYASFVGGRTDTHRHRHRRPSPLF